MPSKKKLKSTQLELPVEINIGDRVDCPLGQGLSVYWVSPSMVWVMVGPTTSKPVYRCDCRKVEASNA